MRPGDLPSAAISLLRPLAAAYAGVIRLRNARYDRNPALAARVGAPVISVGNLTVGGTGKTPLVIELARRLQALERRPAVLTRGYAARRGQPADEALEFQRALPGTPVIVDADRVRGAAQALRQSGVDCLLLDDGFQHRRIARDLDLVVIDALDPWGGGRLLPAGRLREPLEGLRRATLVVLSRANQAPEASVQEIEGRIAAIAPDLGLVRSHVECVSIERGDGATLENPDLEFMSVLPVCGIGNPTTFLALIGTVCARVCPPAQFRDHHPYSRADVRAIQDAARKAGADIVLTTRKDWVKLQPLWPQDNARAAIPIGVVNVRSRIVDPDGLLSSALRRALGDNYPRLSQPGPGSACRP